MVAWKKFPTGFVTLAVVMPLATGVYCGIVIPDLLKDHGYSCGSTVFISLHLSIFVFAYANLFKVFFQDPGFLPKRSDNSEQESRFNTQSTSTSYWVQFKGEKKLPVKLCGTCKIFRPLRASHCNTCGFCVENYDHHCPLVSNCVGKRNYKYFFLFVMSSCCFLIIAIGTFLYHIFVNIDSMQNPSNIASICLIVLSLGFLALLIPLLYFHFFVCSRGITTKEYHSDTFKGCENLVGRGGAVENFVGIVCSPEYPSYFAHAGFQRLPERFVSRRDSDFIVSVDF